MGLMESLHIPIKFMIFQATFKVYGKNKLFKSSKLYSQFARLNFRTSNEFLENFGTEIIFFKRKGKKEKDCTSTYKLDSYIKA